MISQTAQNKFNCGGGIIIGKLLDKLVKATEVKVSTKRWRGGSQTQRYGGSGTGYLLF